VREGIQLPMFKFCSMSSAIVMWSGWPLSWKADHQDRTSLSSCKAEIRATNTKCHLAANIRNMISSLSSLGYPITNAEVPNPLYNDTHACIKWCHNMMTKAIVTSRTKKTLFENEWLMAPSQSPTSAVNAISLTFSRKKSEREQFLDR
jgi:hypothetical protein